MAKRTTSNDEIEPASEVEEPTPMETGAGGERTQVVGEGGAEPPENEPPDEAMAEDVGLPDEETVAGPGEAEEEMEIIDYVEIEEVTMEEADITGSVGEPYG